MNGKVKPAPGILVGMVVDFPGGEDLVCISLGPTAYVALSTTLAKAVASQLLDYCEIIEKKDE